MPALARFAWLVLAWNVAVISWGAYVRATGSGAGCGSHWPLCNGEALPRAAEAATLVEFSHRLTSGLALLAVIALVIWTRRRKAPGHYARRAAAWSLFFIVMEAAVGAGLVLFELVADNASMARAMFMAVHLLNTFFLLGALTLTAWSLTVDGALAFEDRTRAAASIAFGCTALLVAGASGAVAALGDTLFPSASLAEAFAADLSAGSHLLIRLRLLHPFFAVVAAAMVVTIAGRLGRDATPFSRRASRAVMALTGLQLALGFVNVILLAPVWLQLLHLLVADAIWIGFILLGADRLSIPARSAHAPLPAGDGARVGARA
jgi:heme A synthase